MPGKRIPKDLYYLNIAKSVSQRSGCLRRKFGAIIVVNDAIVSTGYNGPARGVVNCEEVGCLKNMVNAPHWGAYDYCPAVHAEENAVINAARNGTSVLGGTLYIYGETADGKPTPSHPCDRCKRVLINAGIERVVTDDENGNLLYYDVKEWVKEDTENYKKRLEEAKGE